jgi:hypothetical protein
MDLLCGAFNFVECSGIARLYVFLELGMVYNVSIILNFTLATYSTQNYPLQCFHIKILCFLECCVKAGEKIPHPYYCAPGSPRRLESLREMIPNIQFSLRPWPNVLPPVPCCIFVSCSEGLLGIRVFHIRVYQIRTEKHIMANSIQFGFVSLRIEHL